MLENLVVDWNRRVMHGSAILSSLVFVFVSTFWILMYILIPYHPHRYLLQHPLPLLPLLLPHLLLHFAIFHFPLYLSFDYKLSHLNLY